MRSLHRPGTGQARVPTRFARHPHLALAVLLSSTVAYGGEGATAPPLDQAIERARGEGKPLFIEFYTTWCGPCKVLEAKVLPLPEVQAALREVTFVRYDAEDGPGVAAAAKLNVSGYPTFVVLDERGTERLREMGVAPEPAKFIDLVGRAADAGLDEAAVRRRVAAAPRDGRMLLRAGRWSMRTLVCHHNGDEFGGF